MLALPPAFAPRGTCLLSSAAHAVTQDSVPCFLAAPHVVLLNHVSVERPHPDLQPLADPPEGDNIHTTLKTCLCTLVKLSCA